MALRRHISYRWRLFLPIVIITWTIIFVLAAFQYNREREYRINNIKEQLSLVNHRIINAYETDMDLISFMDFLGRYYAGNEVFEDMRITVFDEDDVPIYSIGAPLPMVSQVNSSAELIDAEQSGVGRSLRATIPHDDNMSDDDDIEFLFAAQRSADGKTVVFSSLPYSFPVAEILSPGSGLWLFVIILFIIVTAISYVASSIISKNVRLLRDFAQRASDDKAFVATDEFSKDDLGEISRRIVHLYKEKVLAIKEREEEHEKVIAANEEKLRIKKQMTNNISHELKTPVGAIKGYLDTIADYPEMEVEQIWYFIDKARVHMDRLCALLNDLSTITRLEDGAASIMTEAVDMHTLISNIASEMETTFADNTMKFIRDVPKNSVVDGNAGLLYGVIMNFVRNSVAYSRGTEMVIRCVKESDEFLSFEFWDNGVGVAEEHIPHLFDRFFRVDTGRSRKSGGTGLGLPIVQSTIQSLGGHIYVKNRPGGGLHFTFTLRRYTKSDD